MTTPAPEGQQGDYTEQWKQWEESVKAQGLDPQAYLAQYYGGGMDPNAMAAAYANPAVAGAYGAPTPQPDANGWVDPYASPFMNPYSQGPSYYDQTQYDGADGQPTKTIWVGGIDSHTSEPQIRVAFEHFGPISSVKMLPHRNCAFVKYKDINCAIAAYNNMPGKSIGGRQIKVGWGKSDSDTGLPPCKNLWLGNIVPSAREEEIEKLFQSFGPIEKVRVLPHKSCAFVNFVSLNSAEKAKQVMNGTVFKGQVLKINYGKLDEETTIENYNYLKDEVIVKPDRPKDLKLCDIIEKCASRVIEVGPSFEDILKYRQGTNPMFSFLYEDDSNYDYYKWKIFDLRREEKLGARKALVIPEWAKEKENQHLEVHPWQRTGPKANTVLNYTTTVSASLKDSLSEDDRRYLVNMIDRITPDEQPIEAARKWIMERELYVDDICTTIGKRMPQLKSFNTKMAVMYIVNDILHASKDSRNEKFPSLVYPFIEEFLVGALEGHNTDENKDKLIQLLEIWGKIKNFYPQRDMEALMRIVRNVTGTANYHSVAPPQYDRGNRDYQNRGDRGSSRGYQNNRREYSRGSRSRERYKREREGDDVRDDRDRKRHRSKRHRD